MLYCPKCQLLCTDDSGCPSCGTKKLREVLPEDPVLLLTEDEETSALISAAFDENAIAHEERPEGLGGIPASLTLKPSRAVYHIFTPYGQVEQAKDVLRSIGILDEQGRKIMPAVSDEGPQAENTEKLKQIGPGAAVVSALVLAVLVWLCIRGTDVISAIIQKVFQYLFQ